MPETISCLVIGQKAGSSTRSTSWIFTTPAIMSSAYHVDPFGLPGARPYQLPPPRTSVPLQFGTDPFLRPRNREGKIDGGDAVPNYAKCQHLQQTTEQLPSIPSSSTTTMNPPLLFRTRPISLPPISQISANGLGHDTAHPDRHTNAPHQLYPHTSPKRYGNRAHEKESEGFSSPETTDSNKSRKAQVRPHVVDERYVEGEGLCYIYADGTHCPKAIDGVPVNANWGVTKAGKPRKRLAQACLTCREKKIKCQPNLPKCDQCQKSGRECRFESAPRGHRVALKASQFGNRYDTRDGATGGSSNNAGTSSSLYSIARASESSASLPGTNSQSPLSDGSMLTPSALDSNHESPPDPDHYHPAKIRRVSTGHEDVPRHSLDINRVTSAEYADILMEITDLVTQDPVANDWKTDPYATDPELAVHFVETYFTFVNDRLYYIFPRKRFLLWLKSCRTKSLDDNMLLYSMMALGSVFSDRPDKVLAVKRYSRTARYALEHSQHSLSLQLAQSHIIISMWYYAIGALAKSWDAAGAAVRTVCGLRYNVEMGGVIVEQSQPCEYGLHPQALIECRRRTFWVAFLMDRLSCFYAPSTTFISSQTAFLRLPCREDVYEAQEYTTVPFFQSFLNQLPVSQEDELPGLSAMALLIDVMSIWGDVSDHVFRLSLIPAEAYNQLFEDFYSTVVRRSDEWLARLPNHLTFTAVNLERCIRGKKIDPFISIHLLYHATLMKLNRYARSQLLRPGMASKYIRTVRNHAVEILRTALALLRYAAEYDVSQITMDSMPSKGNILSPFLGYVMLSAVDVLSAGGLLIDIPESITLIRGGLEVVRELGCSWSSTKTLVPLIEGRLVAMTDALHQLESQGTAAFFLDGPSLDSHIHNGVQKQESNGSEDLMYDPQSREQFFGALGLVDIPFVKENMLWIKSR
ncbi:hypothetical protein AOCH_004043 [Aspergillus ochraceoroseus]|uniref:Zn(2)-C6 fungal-type domain-containing protein n=1 Tax=Aspergillus ochraceoroseus TaxID=138278 RepID=A0A0F8UPT5_9EURO|nr:hypothetical protein AOCH_004043 [Aspergillus ochraceoroseus]